MKVLIVIAVALIKLSAQSASVVPEVLQPTHVVYLGAIPEVAGCSAQPTGLASNQNHFAVRFQSPECDFVMIIGADGKTLRAVKNTDPRGTQLALGERNEVILGRYRSSSDRTLSLEVTSHLPDGTVAATNIREGRGLIVQPGTRKALVVRARDDPAQIRTGLDPQVFEIPPDRLDASFTSVALPGGGLAQFCGFTRAYRLFAADGSSLASGVADLRAIRQQVGATDRPPPPNARESTTLGAFPASGRSVYLRLASVHYSKGSNLAELDLATGSVVALVVLAPQIDVKLKSPSNADGYVYPIDVTATTTSIGLLSQEANSLTLYPRRNLK